MKVKIVNKSQYELPECMTEMSAGMDLRANIDEGYKVSICPLGRFLFPTGLYIQLPKGYEAQIRPKSELANEHGITVLNYPGTIDADYTGEIKVLLVNISNRAVWIRNGDIIAQMVIAKHEIVSWEEVEVLDSTKRGAGGFGHTGV